MALTEQLKRRAERRVELRERLVASGCAPPSGIALNAVLARCQDVDLAFTALTMQPRPAWVRHIVTDLS